MVRPRKKINLQKTLFLLPNMITLSSVFCGFDSIRRSATARSDEDFRAAALLLIFAMVFDILDGRVARMTKTQSAFGLQIDSLADVISFGVAPALLVYQWSLHSLGTLGLIGSFLFVACGAIRLARFNVLTMGENGQPTKPSKYILGMPIPGAASILMSIVIANYAAGSDLGSPRFAMPMLGVTLLLSFFMVSTVKFRSFKDVKFNSRTLIFLTLVASSSLMISALLKPAFVLVWLLAIYVMLGVGETTLHLVLRASRQQDTTPPT